MTKTEQCLEAIKQEAANGNKLIAPVSFSWAYGRTASAQAFKKAKEQGIIVVNYIGSTGTPVYMGA